MRAKYSSADLLLASLGKLSTWCLPVLIVSALWILELGSSWLTRSQSVKAQEANVVSPQVLRTAPNATQPTQQLHREEVLPEPGTTSQPLPKPAPSPSAPTSGQVQRPTSERHIPPEDPQLTVFALGERRFAERFEREWVEILRGSGFRVVGSLQLESLRHKSGSHPDPLSVVSALAGSASDVLVLIRLEIIDQRDVSFYGRTDTVYRSVIRLDAFSVTDETGLGSWSHDLEFTERGASREAGRGSDSMSSDVVRGLHSGWEEYRSSFAPQ